MSDLKANLNAIASSHRDSALLLSQFVDEMRKGILKNAFSWMPSINEAIDAAQTGRPPHPLIDPHESHESRIERLEQLRVQVAQLDATKQKFPGVFLEMAFIYRVALFDAFLPDTLREVLVHRPEMLKSSKKHLTHEQIVTQGTMTGVIELMVQRELRDLGYESVKDQRQWLRDRGIDPFVSDEQYMQVVELRARRNLFVHANGYVNDIYLSLVPGSPLKKGDRVTVTDQYWTDADRILYVVSNQLFYLVRQKFCGDDPMPQMQDSTNRGC